jgi:P4 family phage/plasmid primase-like protien
VSERIHWQKLSDFERDNAERICQHFFPAGRKADGEWKIGDVSGSDGKSLGIQLKGPNAGLWHDRATGHGGRLRNLIAQNRNITDEAAVEEIERAFGIDFHANGNDHKRSSKDIAWMACHKLTPEEIQRMATWRGLSEPFISWLSENNFLRAHGSNGDARWVFPIHKGGKVAGTHSRPIEWTGRDRCPWLMLPKKDDGGPGVQPFVIGDLSAADQVHIFESTWDLLSVCDKLSLHQTGGAAAFCTRGAQNDKLVVAIPAKASRLYVWQQNDEAGRLWAEKVAVLLPKTAIQRIILAPKQFKDLNEWTLSGATGTDLTSAIKAAEQSSSKRSAKKPEEEYSEEHFAVMLGQVIGQLKCVGDEWYVYNAASGIWGPRSVEEFHPEALRILTEEKRRQKTAKEVVSHLEMRSQVPRSEFCGAVKFVDEQTILIAVANGLLKVDPDKAELLKPRDSEGFTVALPVKYNTGAYSPTFDQILHESVEDEQERELFLDVIATALLPDCRFEAALVQIGEAGTGKSTVSSVFPKIFGDSCSFLSMSDLCHPSGYKLSMLDRKMINIASELNTLEFDDSGLFKQLISGEQMTVRPIYGRPFEMRSTATFVFLANSLPRFKHGTQAEVRRLRFVRFDNKPTIIDTTLKPKVEADAEGVFLKLVKRAQRFLAGHPIVEQSEWGKQTSKRFAISNDPVGQFVQLRCVLGPDKRCSKDFLSAQFEEFKQDHAISDRLSSNHFFRALYERFPGVQSSRVREGVKRAQIITGIDTNDD